MELLGGDAHLAAQTELAAVGKAGGGVDVHGGAVHPVNKGIGVGGVFGDDGLAVAGGVGGNVSDGLVHTVHELHGQDIVQKFGVEVLPAGGRSGDDRRGALVQPQLHGNLACGSSVIHQALFQPGQEFRRHRAVYQQHLFGVAHGGTAGLGVFHNVQGLVQIGALVYIHMADTGTRLNAGHGGAGHAGPDQSRAAPGDQQVHQTLGGHDVRGRLVGGVVHDVQNVRVAALGGDAGLQRLHDGAGGTVGLPAAAEHADIAGFQCQGRRI